MPTKEKSSQNIHSDSESRARTRAIAFGKAIREFRESRGLSRAELLDRFYTELARAGIEYKVKGDWWLNGIENGEKAKQLPREYLNAFTCALECTRIETVRLLILTDLNMLPIAEDTLHAAGLTYVLIEVFTTALKALEARIDGATAAQLDEHEWMEIGKAVLAVVAAEIKDQQRE